MIFEPAAIRFPHLNPVALPLGPLQIRWYGLAYLLGFMLGYALLRRMSRKGTLRVPTEMIGELVSWVALGVMIGGRAGWWLFYHPAQGPAEPWYEPAAIWHGGMSFHGGLIGVSIALLLWARLHRCSLWNLADCLAMVTPIGLFFGRLANFINAELVGRPTSVSWSVIFPGESFPRHPSQLYEALLEGPLLFLILSLYEESSRDKDGQVAALFLVTYGVFRFLVEFTRQPDPQLGFIALGWLTMGQLLSAIIVIAGIALCFVLNLMRRRQSDRAAASAGKPVEVTNGRA